MSAQYKKQHMQKKLVFGLGQTGLSCVRFLVQQGFDVVVFDTREKPPLIETLYREFPHVEVTLQNVSEELFDDVDQIILSPGISLNANELGMAHQRNIEVVGDVEIFALHAKAPIIAITGSNGKTTTTTLVSDIFQKAGLAVETGGNIGTPVLDMLKRPQPDYYILELSSFQLETTKHLKPAVAVILNISPDHMDRYQDLNAYARAKMSIFEGADKKIVNLDDSWLKTQLTEMGDCVGFTENAPGSEQYGLLTTNDNELWIAHGTTRLCNTANLKLTGRHQLMNAVAAVAIADLCNIETNVVCAVLAEFTGLEHRTQFVAEINGVQYINDSKGTNVGATVAAINGLDSPIILLAGGDSKGADFSELADAVKNKVRYAILFGRDAGLIEKAIAGSTKVLRAVSLEAAVGQAHEWAQQGDVVLLSPACASFDMFDNYQQRGEVFMQAVRRLTENV